MPQKNKKIILQIIPNMEIGGAEKSVLEIGSYLKRSKYEPMVLTSGGKLVEKLKKENIGVIIKKIDQKDPLNIYKNIGVLKNLFLKNNISLVHVRSRAPAWSAFYASKKLNLPFMTTWHGHADSSSYLKRKYNSILTKGSAIIANSEYTAKNITKNYNVNINEIDIIPRGVNIEDYNGDLLSNNLISKLRSDWSEDINQKIILLPARYSSWKGHELAIRAISKIKEKNTNQKISLVFIGNKEANHRYILKLKKLAKKLNVDNDLRILGNFDDMALAYNSCDIALYPSIKPEPFGRVPIEAQAAGCLIIASDHGGVKETILDGKNYTGFKTRINDVEDLAEKINVALNLDDSELDKIRQSAINNVIKNFSLENMCKKTLEVYDRILNVPV
tara:strand:+ start:490 stop:1656 length:1167 start_codon:yes stop_codon:yes gene_type:complete